MTPLEIEILLHYATGGDDYRDGEFDAPAVRSAIDRFVDDGWLENEPERSGVCYRATDKTFAFVDALCRVPAPVLVWMLPTQPEGE